MKDKLRIIESFATLTVVAIILVLSILVNCGVFAWFAQNKDVSANGMMIQALDNDIIESIRYYRVTNTTITINSSGAKHNKYHFGYNESILSTQYIYGTTQQERDSFDTPIGMNPYSELSGDCQILIEITLTKQTPITLAVEVGGDAFLGNLIDNKITNGLYDLIPSNLPLSSVVQYAIFSSVATENQAFVLEDDLIEANNYSFIQQEGANYSFVAPVNQNITLGEDRRFFIYFDYHRALVAYVNDKTIEYVERAEVASNNEYNTIILGETNLLFIPDFNFLITETQGGNQEYE